MRSFPGSFTRVSIIRRAAALALSAVSLAAVPGHAATIAGSKPGAQMVSAANIQSVVDYVASKGDMTTRSTDADGKPLVTEAGNHYNISFYDCSDAKDQCQTLQFIACYAGYAQGNVTKTNDLMKNYVSVKAYIDTNNNVCIAEPVATGKGGISYEAMDIVFNAFLWFRQNADAQFK
ncbi:MAG: hypothetical protein P0Y56_06670 [Candidatus Andeanibacterium colombiense]|uniref:YbjN domain-containing protein n=1 Tax=Candidatus Andeanibacterium colombiense TaxID=3121345 RepID=A0AAJ5XB23_9SPHN|nr:MAG: hypothetical protein P0Y56_06670 [Sphingomonadaceae bacterium]